MNALPKARMRKSRPAVIHVGKPLAMRGWKLPAKWEVNAWQGTSGFRMSMRAVRDSREEAYKLIDELFARGWESAEMVEKELLLPLRDS